MSVCVCVCVCVPVSDSHMHHGVNVSETSLKCPSGIFHTFWVVCYDLYRFIDAYSLMNKRIILPHTLKQRGMTRGLDAIPAAAGQRAIWF